LPGVRRLALAVGLLAGCARMAPPPGGPPDGTPPVLLGTVPDSVRVLDGFDGWVEFQFDEVISEGAQPNFGFGNGELEKLILLSPAPDSVVPRVQWRRDRLLVRPRDGWLPNTTYRIELAPGIRDIREPSNASTSASVVTFATGGTLPTRYIVGRAVDWSGSRPAPLALVEALLMPDSLPYRTLADSSGRFAFGPLPQGEFLVRVALDQNRNRRLEATEAWDTVRLIAGRDLVGEIWAFPRDSAPPRIQSAERVDSFTIGLVLTKSLDPGFSLPADSIRVLGLPDSGSIGPIGALPQPAHDSLYRGRGGITPTRPAADSGAAARGDSTPPTPRPARPIAARAPAGGGQQPDTLEQKRPPLTNRLNVRTTGIIQLGTSYLIEVRGVRSIGKGRSEVLRIRLDTPKPPPVDTTKARADSLARRADSLPRRPLR
jgi:hypothetical protein